MQELKETCRGIFYFLTLTIIIPILFSIAKAATAYFSLSIHVPLLAMAGIYALALWAVMNYADKFPPIKWQYVAAIAASIIFKYSILSYYSNQIYQSIDFHQMSMLWYIDTYLEYVFILLILVVAYIRIQESEQTKTSYFWHGMLLGTTIIIILDLVRSISDLFFKISDIGLIPTIVTTVLIAIAYLFAVAKLVDKRPKLHIAPLIILFLTTIILHIINLNVHYENTAYQEGTAMVIYYLHCSIYIVLAVVLYFYFIENKEKINVGHIAGLVLAVTAGISLTLIAQLVVNSNLDYQKNKAEFPREATSHLPRLLTRERTYSSSFYDESIKQFSVVQTGESAVKEAQKLLNKEGIKATYQSSDSTLNIINYSNSTPAPDWLNESSYPIIFEQNNNIDYFSDEEEETEQSKTEIFVLEGKSTSPKDEKTWRHGYSKGINISEDKEVTYWVLSW